MQLEIKGARTQGLWDRNNQALFCTQKLSETEARKLLEGSNPNIIELLYVGECEGWSSLLRSELTA